VEGVSFVTPGLADRLVVEQPGEGESGGVRELAS
jgi:hypothetical protein